MDGVIEQSCGCPATDNRGAVGGVQLDVRRWDLQGAVAGGAAAELETWSLLPAVCPTRWKQLSVLGQLSQRNTSCLCAPGVLLVSFRSKKICPPIHTPDSYPDSYPSAAICSQEPLALWAVRAKLCRPNPQKTGFGRLTAMYQARHGTPPVRGPLASARLRMSHCLALTLVRDWCGWRA